MSKSKYGAGGAAAWFEDEVARVMIANGIEPERYVSSEEVAFELDFLYRGKSYSLAIEAVAVSRRPATRSWTQRSMKARPTWMVVAISANLKRVF